MKIGPMIENLLGIVQKPKAEFAVWMHMSPSGLSKILSGHRLPTLKEKRDFCRQAADFIAEAGWGYECRIRFEPLFPILYDFASAYELACFLEQALSYALDAEYAADNNEAFDAPDRAACYLGEGSALNMLCVLLSVYARGNGIESFELYSSLPLFDSASLDLFNRLRLSGLAGHARPAFHQFMEAASPAAEPPALDTAFLTTLTGLQQHVDLTLWTACHDVASLPFLLLKGHFLLAFSNLMDGTPVMTLIRGKSYVSSFFNTLMKKDIKKISLSGEEAKEAFQRDPDPAFADQLLGGGIDTVFNAISIGYLLRDSDLDRAEDAVSAKRPMIRLFRHVLTTKAKFYVTIDAMLAFYRTGKLTLPLTGIVRIPREERVAYLSRFNDFLGPEYHEKIVILNSMMPYLTLLLSKDYALIYLTDSECRYEKLHILPGEALRRGMEGDLASGRLNPLPFSVDLWASFLNDMDGKQ